MLSDPTGQATEKSTSLERRILGEMLVGTDCSRVLEIGAGTGRLAGLLQVRSQELVALDTDRGQIEIGRGRMQPRPRDSWVVGDGHRLPFADESFSTALMVRVFHRTRRPAQLLSEAHRVLRSGGTLLLSYYPRPSIRTLQFHLWRNLREADSPGDPPGRTCPGGSRPVDHDAGPEMTLRQVRAIFQDCGFVLEREVGIGWEETSLLRQLPRSFFEGLSERLPRAPGYPARLAKLRRA